MAKDNTNSDLLSSSFEGDDKSLLIKSIQETHAPGLDEYGMKPLLAIVEDIMTRANPLSANITSLRAPLHDDPVKSDDRAVAQLAKVLESPINYTSYVMTWKCVGGVDSHAVTMQLLHSLSNYSWDVKAVITYAAFAINYGEFSLLNQSSDLTIATLMGFAHQSFEFDHSDAVVNLLDTAIKLTRCVIDFKDFPPKYINLQPHEIPLVVYLIIRTLVVCASLLTDVLCDHITITDEGMKIISTLRLRLSPVLEEWQDKVINFRNLQKFDGRYIEFQNIISKPSPQSDNLKVLSAFFCPRKDQLPLYDGSRKRYQRLEVLKQKYVLLLITDLGFPPLEQNFINWIHNSQPTRHEYEILWLPIPDPKIPMNETTFRELRDAFPWFSAEHPSAIEPVAIKFIQEDLNFKASPLLAVLDPSGALINSNALPMSYVWGLRAFPFTLEREKQLWEASAWNIDLLADNVDLRLPDWINSNKVICLYGGDNIGWIHRFTKAAQTAAEALHVPLEMLYVGRNNPREEVRVCHEIITKDNLSLTFDPNYRYFYEHIWVFSMWYSKKKLGNPIEGDLVMQGIIDLLSYDSSEQGWAVFSRGNSEMFMARGDNLLPTLEGYAAWANDVDHPDKFVQIFYQNLTSYKPQHHCNRLILPGAVGNIPDTVFCAECGRPMEKYVMYRCCDDE
ncbi:hypothetical protein ACS0TY_009140 [Phlomoides rotata]